MLTSIDLARVSIGTRIRKKSYISYFKGKRMKNVLECGCNVGVYTPFLETISNHLISFDLNESLIRNAAKASPDSQFLAADILKMPFRDGYFDLVVAADVVEHTTDAENVLREMARVTKRNGIAVLSVPCVNWNIVCRVLGLSKYSFGHHYLFEKQQLLSLLSKVGYRTVYYEKMQGAFSACLEGVIVKLSSRLYGIDAVKESQMALMTSRNKVNSFLYFCLFYR